MNTRLLIHADGWSTKWKDDWSTENSGSIVFHHRRGSIVQDDWSTKNSGSCNSLSNSIATHGSIVQARRLDHCSSWVSRRCPTGSETTAWGRHTPGSRRGSSLHVNVSCRYVCTVVWMHKYMYTSRQKLFGYIANLFRWIQNIKGLIELNYCDTYKEWVRQVSKYSSQF